MKLIVLGLSCLTVSIQSSSLSRRTANQALHSRTRRDNKGVFEELAGANLERECIEETCSWKELVEASDSEDAAKSFWEDATKRCKVAGACDSSGTRTCVNEWRSRTCICKDGFEKTAEADDCSLDIDECAAEGWCQNGGDCENTRGGFVCHCQAGWGGDRCELDVDECEASPCLHDGVCTNTDGSFTCECTAEWRGETCEVDVNECFENNPCTNDSGCINYQGGYECLCTAGRGGKHCDEDFDECAASLCPSGTVCEQTDGEFGGFVCSCPERGCNNLDELEYEKKVADIWSEEAIVEEPMDYNATEIDDGFDYDAGNATEEYSDVEEDTAAYDIEEYDASEETALEETDDSNYIDLEETADDDAAYNYDDSVEEDPDYVPAEADLEEATYDETDYNAGDDYSNAEADYQPEAYEAADDYNTEYNNETDDYAETTEANYQYSDGADYAK